MKKIKKHLVSDWADARSWLSMRLMAVTAVFSEVWVSLPPKMQEAIPPDTLAHLTSAFILAAMAGRLIKQGGK